MRPQIWVAVGCLALGGCVDRPSNTGFVGTWSRGNDRATSTISISRDGDAYRFRWRLTSDDGDWSVECDAEGACQEFIDGAETSEFRFVAGIDPESGHLLVECNGRSLPPHEKPIHYVDELVLEPGGLALWSYTNERGTDRFEGDARPKRRLEKVSDRVADVAPRSGG